MNQENNEKSCGGCEGGHHGLHKMKRLGTALIFILCLFVATKTLTELKSWDSLGKNSVTVSTISVSGKGEVVAIPDIATFSFTVSEEAAVVADAQEKATKKMNASLDFIKKSGVAEKDIKTTNYNIYPRYEYVGGTTYYPSGKQVLAAYVVSQDIQVKVRNVADAGKLLSGIGEFGVSNVSGLNFSVDKYDDIVKEARAKAISDAKTNAEKLASDLGVRIVRIMDYSDSSYNPTPVYYAKAMSSGYGGDMMSERAPQIPTGENKITSNVTITYEIR